MKGKSLVSALALLCGCYGAHAAEISSRLENGFPVIIVSGRIIAGDADKFQEVAADHKKAVVVLTGPGGAAMEALRIGEAIRLKQYATLAPQEDACVSSCALAWVAGSRRVMSDRAAIGFHAVYVNGQTNPSGGGNAVVGAYLQKLGLPWNAIWAFTEAPPTGMRFFSAKELADLGVGVETLEELQAKAPPQTPRSLPSEAIDFAHRYVAAISSGAIGGFYPEQVLYYKTWKSRQAVLADFASLIERWPSRRYRVDYITSVQCVEQRCTVSLIMAWNNSNRTRNARSVGASTLSLSLRLNTNGAFLVDAVDGNVTSRHVTTLLPVRQARPPQEGCLLGVLCLR